LKKETVQEELTGAFREQGSGRGGKTGYTSKDTTMARRMKIKKGARNPPEPVLLGVI